MFPELLLFLLCFLMLLLILLLVLLLLTFIFQLSTSVSEKILCHLHRNNIEHPTIRRTFYLHIASNLSHPLIPQNLASESSIRPSVWSLPVTRKSRVALFDADDAHNPHIFVEPQWNT